MYPLPDEKTIANGEKALGVFEKYFLYVVIVCLSAANVYQYFETRAVEKEKTTLQGDRIKDLKEGLQFNREGYHKSQQEIIDEYRRRTPYAAQQLPGNKP